MADLQEFEKNIGVSFKDRGLLEQVFIHRSFLNEHPDVALENNERLEFLGDAVLELIVTEYLYKHFKKSEGELTNLRSALVNGEKLSQLAKKFSFGDYLKLSKGEEKSGGKEKQVILASAFEAFLGAFYLEKGLEPVRKFIEKELISDLPTLIKNGAYIDPKTRFQEIVQEHFGVTPFYKVLKEEGPDHNKTFTVGVYIKHNLVGTGKGSSKQKAQTEAAINALAQKNNWLPKIN
jgi:ribonuclease-3